MANNIKRTYDFLIVGAGLFGCVCAERLSAKGYNVLVVEKKNHIGGTCYTENVDSINVHKYGAHIFRTNDKEIFSYISQFCEFNNFVNSPIAICKGQAYNLPFNMNTFSKVFNVIFPYQAKKVIDEEIKKYGCESPSNLKEQAINLAGKTIYEMFIKEYTEKQWGRACEELPVDIIRRIPLRFTYDNNYYNARYQGIPIGGYTAIFEKMLSKCKLILNKDFNTNRDSFANISEHIIYTGPIDEYFDYCFGELEYRGLKFEEQRFDVANYQGNAVLNYSDKEVPYTRSIEHKHFEFGTQDFTVVSYEYPVAWKKGDYPYYPVNNEENNNLYKKYKALAEKEGNVIFGGRLGLYQYFDMQDTIRAAFDLVESL